MIIIIQIIKRAIIEINENNNNNDVKLTSVLQEEGRIVSRLCQVQPKIVQNNFEP